MQAGVKLPDLAKYENLNHHDQVAKAVLSGQFDAGALKDIVAFRYQPMGLRFLSVSEPIPSVPVVMRKDAPVGLKEAVVRALLKLDRNRPDHRVMMSCWNEELRYGFTTATDADYEPIRIMLNTIPGRCGESCHPSLRF
jgi:phosphonate transport system substrate-binding protein